MNRLSRLLIRGYKVMLDSELAELYQVSTKVLNQEVRRNLDRFPADFMFQLNDEELENWRSQIVTSNPRAKMGLRCPPYAFTEHGVAMLVCPHEEARGRVEHRLMRDNLWITGLTEVAAHET